MTKKKTTKLSKNEHKLESQPVKELELSATLLASNAAKRETVPADFRETVQSALINGITIEVIFRRSQWDETKYEVALRRGGYEIAGGECDAHGNNITTREQARKAATTLFLRYWQEIRMMLTSTSEGGQS
jgi:hypothetical protein